MGWPGTNTAVMHLQCEGRRGDAGPNLNGATVVVNSLCLDVRAMRLING